MLLNKTILLFLMINLLLFPSCKSKILHDPIQETVQTTYLNDLSEDLLKRIIAGQNTQDIQDQLAKVSLEEIAHVLIHDDQRFAFWINIYNAYIQVILSKHPEYYQDRNSFFDLNQINIGGELISFSFIEHGIIRRSQWLYGLGYVSKLFPSQKEKSLRVNKKNYRIHFALNCGAKDCPPVAVYTATRINDQMQKATKSFLKKTTEYDPETQEARVTALFSWFRGDFGGLSGTKEVLQKNGLIQSTESISLRFKSYDWTLKLDNYVDL